MTLSLSADPGAALFLIIVTGVLALAVIQALRRRSCPMCATRLPLIRKPADDYEALWGGWTCRTCGARLDNAGKVRDEG